MCCFLFNSVTKHFFQDAIVFDQPAGKKIEPEAPKILSEYLLVIKSELHKYIKIIYRMAIRMAVKLKSNGTLNVLSTL